MKALPIKLLIIAFVSSLTACGGGSGSSGGAVAGKGKAPDDTIDVGDSTTAMLTGVWLLPCDEGVREGFRISGASAEMIHRFYEYGNCSGTGTDIPLASFSMSIGDTLITGSGIDAHEIDLTYTSAPTDGDTYTQGDTIYSIVGTDSGGDQLYFGAFSDSPATRSSDLNLLEAYDHDATGNTAPEAHAGKDRTVNAGATVVLNGSGSFDPDGSLIHYQWNQTDGVPISLDNANSATTSFVAPYVSDSEELIFTLTVTDNAGVSVTDSTRITVVAEGAPADSDLDAEFSMIIEGPLGTTGGYMNDPVSIEFGTFNDHIQNYSPAPTFSWGYLESGDLTEEQMNNLDDSDFTIFSTHATHSGAPFTYELDTLYPDAPVNYFYFRLVVQRPDGSIARHTKKAVFPMVRAYGYLNVDGTLYSLDPSAFDDFPPYEPHNRITFENIEPATEEYLPYTVIEIPYKNDIFPELVSIEVAEHFPADSFPSPLYQVGENPNTSFSAYTQKGFFFQFGDYATFDDPSGAYSRGSWGVVGSGTNGHPDIQGTLELEMTLRGNNGSDATDEIQARLNLSFITRKDLNIWGF